MTHINDLHEEAMDLADEALMAKRQGHHDQAIELFRKAFGKERAAAELVQDDLLAEPTRSILHRSAAYLALDCGEVVEAKRLIRTGLAGNPPQEIAHELRELLEQVERMPAQEAAIQRTLEEHVQAQPIVLSERDVIIADDTSDKDLSTVIQTLQAIKRFPESEAELLPLAEAIMPYLKRTHLPMPDAVIQIATNYRHDGPRVQRLLADPEAEDWHEVMVQVVETASARRRYPDDVDAHRWPDLDAYEDIRKKLPSYNFEGKFEHWVTVITINRLQRFWRDQQAISRGGVGFQSKAQRDTAAATGQFQFSPRATMQSLDLLLETNRSVVEILQDSSLSAEDVVAAAELDRLLEEIVAELAKEVHEPRLFDIWRAVVIEEQTLSEVAKHFGKNITFIHRRVKLVQKHIQQDARLKDWHEPDDI